VCIAFESSVIYLISIQKHCITIIICLKYRSQELLSRANSIPSLLFYAALLLVILRSGVRILPMAEKNVLGLIEKELKKAKTKTKKH
jgi:hypothetical protein